MSLYSILFPTMQNEFKSLKKYMKEVAKTKKKIDELKEQMEELYWMDDDKEKWIRSYQELKALKHYWKLGKISVKYSKQRLLKEANLTG